MVQTLEMEAFQSNLEERQTLANIQIPPSKVAIYFMWKAKNARTF